MALASVSEKGEIAELQVSHLTETQLEETNRVKGEGEQAEKTNELQEVLRLLEEEQSKNQALIIKQKNIEEEFLKYRQWMEDQASNNYSVVNFTEFTSEELRIATDNFAEKYNVGEDEYATLYKTDLGGKVVAIKILNIESRQGEREFNQEVKILRRLRHPSLVTLIGACLESWALVYEVVPNRNLQEYLQIEDLRKSLSWKTRIHIALNICSAVIFLHTTKPHGIAHGNLIPANILLDSNYECKLSNFGISRQMDLTKTTATPHHKTNQPKGTLYYMDPEYVNDRVMTLQSDVYAFGIVLLQLITGKGPMELRNWVERKLKKGVFDNIAPVLAKKRMDKLLDASAKWPPEVAKKMTDLGLKCSHHRRKRRPDLANEVLVELKYMELAASRSLD